MTVWLGVVWITFSFTACAAEESLATLKQLIDPFTLSAVRLHPRSPFARAAELNTQYMVSLEPDSLLFTFRQNAGLPTPGQPYVGSWEDPGCEVRGQFMGHYLSASATLLGQTDDPKLSTRTNFIVAELKKVQDKMGGGYLSAFPTEHFDRLQNLQPVWAPFYVIHKIMAGLLDLYTFTDNELALHMVTDMAAYFSKRIDDTIKADGIQHWHKMLNNEFGGMAEVLFNLYAVTKDKEHSRLAELFTKPTFYEPLIALEDPLPGLHANTHLAQVNGFAAQHEKTGNKDALTAVQHFFQIVTQHHSFATGGSNDHEFWGPPDTIGDAISEQQHATETEETCTQYNMLKIARYLFRWTGNVTYADYYEKAILNGLLGTQRMPAKGPALADAPLQPTALDSAHEEGLLQLPNADSAETSHSRRQLSAVDAYSGDWRQAAFAAFRGANDSTAHGPEEQAGPGQLLYLMPLGAGQGKGGSTHGWGTPLHSFWCCYGSSVESFAKLVDSIYFYRVNKTEEGQPAAAAAELYVNQLVSSSLTWQDLGLKIKQTASFSGPDQTALTKLEFESNSSDASPQIVVKLRVPGWVVEGAAEVRLNGQPWKECHQHSPVGLIQGTALSAGSYCSLKGSFNTGDVITAKFPMIIRADTVQDSRPEVQALKAVMLGPLLMAGLTDGSRQITANASNLAPLVSDVNTTGLVSLRALHPSMKPPGTPQRYLQHTGVQVLVATVSDSNAGAMAATFRVVQMLDRETVMLESMDRPGHYIQSDQGDSLTLQPLQNSSKHAQEWLLRHTASTDNRVLVTLEDSDRPRQNTVLSSSVDQLGGADISRVALAEVQWALEAPLGQYPDGSKVLKGQDEMFIISPLGNIVDERYTAYFEFKAPSS